ncbi:shikimate dehydrogenase [Gammaproteobacteria bacterium]|nr:shikimate dehydrogenase [Gammaproteobacteria bacterium]
MKHIDQYAVLGNPISHSKSPIIHSYFAKQTNQFLSYSSILILNQTQLSNFFRKFRLTGGKGVNITSPWKKIATNYVDNIDNSAKKSGSINTIKFDKNNNSTGFNTDGDGFIRDLMINKKFRPKNKNILIIGAGGAAYGILVPLLEQCPNKITIINRSETKALSIVNQFKKLGNIQFSHYETLAETFDLIINTSNADLVFFQKLTNKILNNTTFCYDLIYSDKDTPFLQYIKNLGVKNLSDGYGMLIEQAALSFYIWRNIMPNTSYLLDNI